MPALLRAACRLAQKRLPPRPFSTNSRWPTIPASHLVEEETWEWYSPETFYPVRIGEVFKAQYQVVGKLGFGGSATVWLCRDLLEHRHVAMKIGAHRALASELTVSRYLNTVKTSHVGSTLVRRMLDEFEVTREEQRYQAIIYEPLAITLRGFRKLFASQSLPVDLLKLVLQHIFIALDFLHTHARVIHTDIQEKNILLGLDARTAAADCTQFEEHERASPSARKTAGGRTIHTSRPLVPRIYNYGRPVLCDLGAARVGAYDPLGDIQPYAYRAPEVILDGPWDHAADIWNVGVLIWDLFENGSLFRTTGGPDGREDNAYHLAHMVALLGPPPADFLARSRTDRPWRWFDRAGNWRGAADVPDASLEDAEGRLAGEEKALFLRFVRRMLAWRPEERASALELLDDPWIKL